MKKAAPPPWQLTRPQLGQLLSYIEDAERLGWYYGCEDEFRKRHAQLKDWVELQLTAPSTSSACPCGDSGCEGEWASYGPSPNE
jgi:hypothetical protein